MVLNFLSGGAAINVLARLNRAEVNIVDLAWTQTSAAMQGSCNTKYAGAAGIMLQEPAMSEEELAAALSAGLTLAEAAFVQGNNLIAVGEMGIATPPPPAS